MTPESLPDTNLQEAPESFLSASHDPTYHNPFVRRGLRISYLSDRMPPACRVRPMCCVRT